MDEVAIVDTSPLICLGQIGRLDLLRLAASRVLVPRRVTDEIAAKGPEDPAVRALRAASWIGTIETVATPREIEAWDLGAGETQVLSLARSTPLAVAIVDDLEARRCARALGIALRGTLGIILVARRRGVIPLARPVVDLLRRSGMRLADDVVDRALRDVGE